MTFPSSPASSLATYSLSMPCISVCVSGYHAAVPYIMRAEVTVCHRLYWAQLLMNRAERGRDAGANTFQPTWKSLFHLSWVLRKRPLGVCWKCRREQRQFHLRWQTRPSGSVSPSGCYNKSDGQMNLELYTKKQRPHLFI